MPVTGNILKLEHTADEFDNLIRNVPSSVQEIAHDTEGPLFLDIEKNRSFNIFLSANVTEVGFINIPTVDRIILDALFFQNTDGGWTVNTNNMYSMEPIIISTEANRFSVVTLEIRKYQQFYFPFCRNNLYGLFNPAF